MPSYTLEISAYGVYTSNIPSLEIWEDGVLNSTHSITSSGSTISVTISYGGSLPTSLSFVFNDGFAANGRTIEIQSVKINDKYVNTGNFLSSDSLVKSASASVDIANSDFIFSNSADPAASEFTTGATQTFTSGNDTYRNWNGTTDEIFNMLGGSDYAHLGSGNDKVSGGAGNDIIRGGGGTDLLFGDDGNDRLYGNDGDDEIYGGLGNDRLYGNDGDDEIHGGDGDDRLIGGNNNDTLAGGAGDDILVGGSGVDYLYGDADNDKLIGDAGDDTLDGGDGDDLLYAGAGDDILDGGDGVDIVIGGLGNDIVNGGAGNDELHGGRGNDTLNGGAGDDVINLSLGHVTIEAVTVADIIAANPTLTYNAGTGNFYSFVAGNITYANAVTAVAANTVNGTAGHLATITSGAEDAVIAGLVNGSNYGWIALDDSAVEGTFLWSAGPETGTGIGGWSNWAGINNNTAGGDHVMYLGDTWGDAWYTWASTNSALGYVAEWEGSNILVTGSFTGYDSSAESNTVNGGAGNDTINGSMGDDIIDGGADNDTINADEGDDTIYSGLGTDIIDGGKGTDTLIYSGAVGNITVNLDTGAGTDTISNIENVTGGDFNDTITGDANDNIIIGGAGNDTITSGAGDDVITGGAGDDVLGSTATSVVTVADILAANPNLTYDAGTGNFYDFVAGNINYASALAAVTANTVNGVAGHLATITSGAEDAVIGTLVNGTDYGWIALDDSGVEGTFLWNAGPEAGTGIGGWSNWAGINNNTAGGDHVMYLGDNWGDAWYTWASTNTARGYVAEWEGSDVLGASNFTTDTVSISGGDGLDTLYGGSGIDTFIFESASAFNDIDVIENFVTGVGGDAIDISDLLAGFSGPITDWVQFVDSGSDTLVQVDANGTSGGASFTTIGQINDLTGLDEATLYTDGNIIV